MATNESGEAEFLRKFHEQFPGESDDGRPSYEPISPALAPVNRLLKQRDDAVALCGEMLATLQLPANQEEIAKLIRGGFIGAGPVDIFTDLVKRWRLMFEKCSGNPN